MNTSSQRRRTEEVIVELPPAVPEGHGNVNWPSPLEKQILDALKKGDSSEIQMVWRATSIAATEWTPDRLLRMSPFAIADSLVEWLLSQGARVEGAEDRGFRPLHVYCSLGRASIVEILLRHGARVDSHDDIQETPLGHCIHADSMKSVQLLLDYGADPLQRTSWGLFPAAAAVARERQQIYRLLRGVVGTACDFEIAMAAIDTCQWGILREVVAGVEYNSWSIESPQMSHMSLVHSAAMCRDTCTAMEILDPSADQLDCFSANHLRETPLMTAARMGNRVGVELLLAMGAVSSLRNADGKTAKELAGEFGFPEMSEILDAP